MNRITCFIESLAGGGAEHQMSILCGMLIEKGYEVTLVTYADVNDHYDCPPAVHRVRLGSGKTGLTKFFAVFHYFLKVKTDCLISYRVACNARVLLPLLFRPKIKVIVGERNLTMNGRSHLGKLCDNILYYRANNIVANSHSQESYLRSLGKRWATNVSTIINYTDLNQFKPSAILEQSNVIKVAVFARFSPQKNAPRFIKMLVELKKNTTVPFHIDWYGSRGADGNDQGYVNSYNLICEYSLEDTITLKEPVKNPSSVMNEYQAICLPSLYEGFSNSIAEGICSGKPMLVSNVSDNPIMVQDGVNGFLFDPTSIDSMQNAFVNFFNTSLEQKRAMGKKSREIAESLFDSETFFKKYKLLIDNNEESNYIRNL